jgi:hypothetical protein
MTTSHLNEEMVVLFSDLLRRNDAGPLDRGNLDKILLAATSQDSGRCISCFGNVDRRG